MFSAMYEEHEKHFKRFSKEKFSKYVVLVVLTPKILKLKTFLFSTKALSIFQTGLNIKRIK